MAGVNRETRIVHLDDQIKQRDFAWRNYEAARQRVGSLSPEGLQLSAKMVRVKLSELRLRGELQLEKCRLERKVGA